VMPIGEGEGRGKTGGAWNLVRKEIQREIGEVARGYVDVELVGDDQAIIYVEEDDIPFVIGKNGATISDIEERLGISIEVKSHDERPESMVKDSNKAGGQVATGAATDVQITSRHVIMELDGMEGETVEVYADGEYLFTATVGRRQRDSRSARRRSRRGKAGHGRGSLTRFTGCAAGRRTAQGRVRTEPSRPPDVLCP